MVIAAGVLSLGTWYVGAVTFGLAYLIGWNLTVGPLMEEGVDFWTAVKDALYAETPSITIMEIVAIVADIWIAGSANIGQYFSGLH